MTRSRGRATRSPRSCSAARRWSAARSISRHRRSATSPSTRTAPAFCWFTGGKTTSSIRPRSRRNSSPRSSRPASMRARSSCRGPAISGASTRWMNPGASAPMPVRKSYASSTLRSDAPAKIGSRRMDFGIGIATSRYSWKLAQRAEELGFTHAWFFDTQMITGDCFVAMAAAALKTSRIRLGTGVLVPSNRIAAVTANALATLNGLAPGRVDFGIGTGFTARRAMGLGSMKLAEMEEYIRVVYGLLAAETVETKLEGKDRKIRFLNPELGLFNTKDEIPLHISAYGPRSQALTARLGARWKCFIQDVPGALGAVQGMQQTWGGAGHAPSDLYATAWVCGCVLQPGEPL